MNFAKGTAFAYQDIKGTTALSLSKEGVHVDSMLLSGLQLNHVTISARKELGATTIGDNVIDTN